MSRYNNRAHPADRAQAIRERYPELCGRMDPHIDDAVSGLGQRRQLSRLEMGHLSYQVAMNSNILHDPPHGLAKNDIREIASLLILAALYKSDGW